MSHEVAVEKRGQRKRSPFENRETGTCQTSCNGEPHYGLPKETGVLVLLESGDFLGQSGLRILYRQLSLFC
jgi:hypothetical protein